MRVEHSLTLSYKSLYGHYERITSKVRSRPLVTTKVIPAPTDRYSGAQRLRRRRLGRQHAPESILSRRLSVAKTGLAPRMRQASRASAVRMDGCSLSCSTLSITVH